MLDLILRNTRLPDGSIVDLSIKNGKVEHVGSQFPAAESIDCSGLLCLPGTIDMHVHMRGGSQSYKEDWTSGSMSAIAGGVTFVVDQPNTLPPITNPDLLSKRVKEATGKSYCNFAINAAVVPGVDLKRMWESGALAFGEIFVYPSSFGSQLKEEDLHVALAEISRIGSLATIHAEEVPTNDSTNLIEHDIFRSAEGEEKMVRIISASKSKNHPCHFCHCSTSRAIDAIGGSVEVTPHHLLLSIEHFNVNDGRGKVNPPLRHEEVRKNLWSRWERIDVIASDHAPHTLSEKSQIFSKSPAGIPGVETMVPLCMAMVLNGKVSLESLIQKISSNPSAILGIPRAGFIKGNRADFALFPRQKQKIRTENLHSKCGWTPYEGFEGVFPEIVVMNGSCVFKRGEYFQRNGRWFPGRGYIHQDAT